MPRISEITDDGGDPTLKPIFDKQRELFGGPLNPTKVLAHCPPILKAAGILGLAFEQSGQLPRGLLPLIYTRVATINGCPFWMDINAARAAEATEGGLDKLGDLLNWRDSTRFSEAERVALEYAERITYTDQQVDDELFGRVKKHFTEPQIVELTAAIAFENFRSKFNPPLGIEAQGFCVVPARKWCAGAACSPAPGQLRPADAVMGDCSTQRNLDDVGRGPSTRRGPDAAGGYTRLVSVMPGDWTRVRSVTPSKR